MSRKKKQTPNSDRGQILRLVLVLILVGAVGVGILLGTRYLDRRINDQSVQADTFQPTGAHDNYIRGTLKIGTGYYDYFHNFENFLIMGTDYTGNEEGTGEDFQNSMADFLMVMSIDKTDDSFSLIEIDRNTMAEIRLVLNDGTGEATSLMQLCTAHWYGGTKEMGCENQVSAVSQVLGGLPIAGYYSMRIEDVPQLNHAIGGVTVTLEDDFTYADPEMKKGATLKLSDEQAYTFLRARMNVGDGSNVERMARQHAYLEGFLSESLGKLSENKEYYYNLFDTLESIAVTNLTGKQISRIAKALTQDTRRGIFGFEGKHTQGKALPDGKLHDEFYISTRSLLSVMTELFGLVKGDKKQIWNESEWRKRWESENWRLIRDGIDPDDLEETEDPDLVLLEQLYVNEERETLYTGPEGWISTPEGIFAGFNRREQLLAELPETVAEIQTEPELETISAQDIDLNAGILSDLVLETEVESEPETQSEPETVSEIWPKIYIESETESDTQTDMISDPEPEILSEIETEQEPETREESETELESKHTAETETESELIIETKQLWRTETVPEYESESEFAMESGKETEPKFIMESETETDSKFVMESETEIESESETEFLGSRQLKESVSYLIRKKTINIKQRGTIHP